MGHGRRIGPQARREEAAGNATFGAESLLRKKRVSPRKPPAACSGGEVTNLRKNQFVGEYHLTLR